MTDMQQSLVERQRALEEESVILGVARYEKNRTGKEETQMSPGRKLLLDSLTPVTAAIEAFIEKARTGGAGRRHTAVKWLEKFDPGALACLTASHVINAVSREPIRLQTLAVRIAKAIEEDVNYQHLKDEQPGLYHHLMKTLQKATATGHVRRTMAAAMRSTDTTLFEFPTADRLTVGAKLVEIFVEATGTVAIRLDTSRGRSNRRTMVVPEPVMMEWLEKAHDSAAHFWPVRLPMLCPPKPWTGSRRGGYLTSAGGREVLVRVRNQAYLDELDNVDMPIVYDAINAIQATPWKVNRAVLEVMDAVWEAGGGMAGIPSRELLPLPDHPEGLVREGDAWKAAHPDEFKAWKKSRAEVYEANARSVGKRVTAGNRVALAKRFANEEAIYFPHSFDFRGRVYPIPTLLTPQGDDPSKALLMFAEGKPLGERGAFWLAVHIANEFGVDKVSFEERVAWVYENEKALLDSAIDPLDGERFWTTADAPWCALAACIEWAGYCAQGEDYVSHLPVGLDGSCNGLQNFSAMLRDEVGGKATNIIPADKPADIYTEVLNVAIPKVRAAAEAGKKEAQYWDGRLSRKDCKRPVMTLPYGVTRSGMRGQIMDQMRKDTGKADWGTADYLAGVLWGCVGEVVVAAADAMAWLKEAARAMSAGGMPVSWTTPAGFPVLQEYREQKGRKLNVHVSGRRVQLLLNTDGQALDRRRQLLGISPNFVHSCDASHLMLTVTLAASNDITSFAMIHDSYGTHAASVDTLAAALRHAFVEQYSEDVLGNFRNELVEQLPTEQEVEIPPLPPTGNLELEQVLDSQYFFA